MELCLHCFIIMIVMRGMLCFDTGIHFCVRALLSY